MIFGETFRRVVNDISDTHYYNYGHPLEIVNDLSEKAQNGTLREARFPLIALFLDVPESIPLFGSGHTLDPFTVVLMQDTKPTYTAHERSINVFPNLNTLYDSLITAMQESSLIQWNGEHQKILRYYWGKSGLYGNTGNIFNDYIDAIEIELTGVKLLTNCSNTLSIDASNYTDYLNGNLEITIDEVIANGNFVFADALVNDFLVIESTNSNKISSVTYLDGGEYKISFDSGFVAGDSLIIRVYTPNGLTSNYLTINL